MAQTGYTPISLYYSSTTGAAPTAGQLVNGELALNIRDGYAYYKTSGGAVALLAHANPRIASVTSASTITPNSATTDQFEVTALATGLTVNAPSGTPVDGQKLIIRILDNGTSQTITWTTSSTGYRVVGSVLPTTTVPNKVSYVGCIWNSQASYWDAVAVANET